MLTTIITRDEDPRLEEAIADGLGEVFCDSLAASLRPEAAQMVPPRMSEA